MENRICAPIMGIKWLIEESNKRLDSTLNIEVKRLEQIQSLEVKRLDERVTRFSDHFKELATAEAKRIDAIRSVDVAAVATASDKAAEQAVVLANQVNTSAETLRTLVAATATTVAAQLQQLSNQLSDRLTVLEKS
jgi:hypothetical protein